jgi:hypothetical protein
VKFRFRIQPGAVLHANDTLSIKESTFDPLLPTKILIHGWKSNGYEVQFKVFIYKKNTTLIIYSYNSVQTMASNLLKNGDFNVITVHWGDGASGSYIQSACNTRLVALEIALLINTLKVFSRLIYV